MSLLFVEGFDHYNNTNDIPKKWTAWSGTPSFETSIVRTGTQSLRYNNNNRYVAKTVAGGDTHTTFISGFGLNTALATDTAFISFYGDSFATQHLSLCVDTLGAIRVTRGGRTGTTLGTTTNGVIIAGSWHYIEFKATLNDSTGVVVVKVDGKQVLNLTGQDTKNGGTASVFDTVQLGPFESQFNVIDSYFDDFYLCNGAGTLNNDLLGECRVRTIYPDGNGNSSQLVGSDADSTNNYQLVDEATPNTADYVGSAVTDDKDTYTFQDLVDTSGTVAGVQLGAYATKTDSGSRSFAFVTRTGGTDYDSSDIVLQLGSNNPYFSVRETNPNTTVAWTRSDVNGAEFGFKVRP